MSKKMWFGVEGRMRWVDTPQSGADVSPKGFSVGGTLLNGGGYADGSFGSHKEYGFSWSGASSRQAAGIMQAYAAGTYGRGLIYFLDPHTLDTNVLPAHWADPSLAIGDESPQLIRSRRLPLTGVPTANAEANDIPAVTAVYDLADAATGFPGERDSLFIPVPPGTSLRIGAIYTRTGSGGIFAAPVDAAGTAGTATLLTQVSPTATDIIPDEILPGAVGVRVWLGKSADGPATVSVAAMIGRIMSTLTATATSPKRLGPWMPGDGHTGCRFVGKPTLVRYNGVGGGQVGYATTLTEVGAWEY
ncbi:hypothetical protein MRBLMI12_000506 [Microbacterium sp. LMI12-1-1.1]|uniref:hypothetical protein n=1 Tax=Microbacterium sp. LMI12-1-1.1 TaxID=3135225 RepID=UPI003426EAD0